MENYKRQYIGIIAGEQDTDRNIFINAQYALQYRVKSLLLPQENVSLFSGYISSLEDDFMINDSEYADFDERINNFREVVEDKLFIFSYRVNELGFASISSRKANLVQRPPKFTEDTLYYAIPVFSSYNNKSVQEWEKEKNWRLFREYYSMGEFKEYIKDKKSVGRIFGYSSDHFTPSFVFWLEEDGDIHAIGHIAACRENTRGGCIFESDHIIDINVTKYEDYWVYQESLNPTVLFLPENIYVEIENCISESLLDYSKNENSDSALVDNESIVKESFEIASNITSADIKLETEEKLIDIDVSIKSDELIIQSMDYHSQKSGLFYNMKDMANFHTAVKCNHLVILSGLSGTGKSALVNVYAKALGITSSVQQDEKQLLFIPVRPFWNDDSDLLGYVDLVHMVYRASDSGFVDFLVRAQKEENQDKLFIVCFDEMNLARVEHYFSQFLSLLELPANQRELRLYDKQYSGRLYNSADYPYSIRIGDNIKFIGTVNIDESTYHFSDKVLDRANVIQLDILDYSKEWNKKNYSSLKSIVWSSDEYNSIIRNGSADSMQRVHELLWDIHTLLQSANGKYGVGPRIVKNIDKYLYNLPNSNISGFTYSDGIDLQIAQRILTKVRGPENQLGTILSDIDGTSILNIFDKYSDLSDFKNSRRIVLQKQKELMSYGYCI